MKFPHLSWRLGALAGLLLSPLSSPLSCNGTTGDELLTFSAYASGAPGASDPFTAGDFTIQLTAARMHIGALYFDESPPGGTGFGGPVCIAAGVFAGQVPGPVDVDLLSTTPQEFSVYGSGTADTALSWQVWLTDGDINQVNFTPVVQLEGIATDSGGHSVSFGAVISINALNRSKGSPDPSQPGLDPLCKLRIVQIPADFRFFAGGALHVTIDPRVWFTQQVVPIDFSAGQLPPITDPNCNPDGAVVIDAQGYALAPSAPSPTVCIPNSSLLSGAVPGASAGVDLYSEVVSASAFSVQYAGQ
jgi:hypothetical protein